MSDVTFTMTDFTFPAKLKDAYATFRIQLVLSYRDKGGKPAEVKEIMPGGGEKEYWECEKGHKDSSDYVRQKDAPKIDISKILEGGGKAIFRGLEYKSLDQVTVTIFDVEKDGFFDDFWHEAAKMGFGVALELLSSGKAITVGNALTALKKKPDDRSDVEKQFDDMIAKSKKANKTRTLWEHIADISNVTDGDHFSVTGNSPLGIFIVDFVTDIS